MTGAPEHLVRAIGARDFGAIEACFTADASMRVLTPRSLRELRSASEAADRFRAWFGDMDGFCLLDSDIEPVADRVRIRWRTRGRDPEKGWQENEHTAYAALDDEGLIAALNVSCAGFRPASPA